MNPFFGKRNAAKSYRNPNYLIYFEVEKKKPNIKVYRTKQKNSASIWQETKQKKVKRSICWAG